MFNLDVEVDISCKEVVQFLGCCLAITGFVYVDDKYNDGRMTKGIKEAFLNKTECSKDSSEKSGSNSEHCKIDQLDCERVFSLPQRAVKNAEKIETSRAEMSNGSLQNKQSNKISTLTKRQTSLGEYFRSIKVNPEKTPEIKTGANELNFSKQSESFTKTHVSSNNQNANENPEPFDRTNDKLDVNPDALLTNEDQYSESSETNQQSKVENKSETQEIQKASVSSASINIENANTEQPAVIESTPNKNDDKVPKDSLCTDKSNSAHSSLSSNDNKYSATAVNKQIKVLINVNKVDEPVNLKLVDKNQNRKSSQTGTKSNISNMPTVSQTFKSSEHLVDAGTIPNEEKSSADIVKQSKINESTPVENDESLCEISGVSSIANNLIEEKNNSENSTTDVNSFHEDKISSNDEQLSNTSYDKSDSIYKTCPLPSISLSENTSDNDDRLKSNNVPELADPNQTQNKSWAEMTDEYFSQNPDEDPQNSLEEVSNEEELYEQRENQRHSRSDVNYQNQRKFDSSRNRRWQR